MKVVVGASTTIKWFIPDNEEDTEQAIQLFKNIQVCSVEPVQPIHWQAEVIAVLSRIKPETSVQSIKLLSALEFPVWDNIETYQEASKLAITLKHHLFDTLYHAVALEKDALLITADKKYYNKAKNIGNILLLNDYQIK